MTRTAKTRIVCISDTHNQTPSLPKGDVLVCAGDVTNQGTVREVERFVRWVEKTDFEVRVVVGGNHDITLDESFYEEHWRSFHNQGKQSTQECRALLKNSPSITYLQHESAAIKLSSPTGPHTQFSIFGSPYSPAHNLWAFGYEPDAAKALWDEIPLETDVVVTHTPPAGHCDQQISKNNRAGCEELRRRLWAVRPLLHVCGHIHEGRGVEKVTWKDSIDRAPFLEESIEIWTDPGGGEGNRKQSLVKLTTGRGNGNGVPLIPPPTTTTTTTAAAAKSIGGVKRAGKASYSGPGKGGLPSEKQLDSLSLIDSKKARIKNSLNHSYRNAIRDVARRSLEEEDHGWNTGTGGETLVLESRISRDEVRWGRRETCIVNAAIMAKNWGERGSKRFNKPIVVDVDLPVWEE
ncbi:hypothetical protein FKW77_002060 [Venturia effusa]|uniref:Calcineurin-like phosphoesterase domain-containing protein n=1 Tax=Venturia effusa TaxID=50376 RepID=A0A517LDH0_9PEZI|nr:hypothetical protein FKW77_002060 [Venturia effusa]